VRQNGIEAGMQKANCWYTLIRKVKHRYHAFVPVISATTFGGVPFRVSKKRCTGFDL
jgi:hypothetical protein